MNNKQFLTQKKENFSKFIQNVEKDHKDQELQPLQEWLNKGTLDEFVLYVATELKQYEKNLSAFIIKLFSDNKIDITHYNPEELEKFKQYLACFIEVVSS